MIAFPLTWLVFACSWSFQQINSHGILRIQFGGQGHVCHTIASVSVGDASLFSLCQGPWSYSGVFIYVQSQTDAKFEGRWLDFLRHISVRSACFISHNGIQSSRIFFLYIAIKYHLIAISLPIWSDIPTNLNLILYRLFILLAFTGQALFDSQALLNLVVILCTHLSQLNG
jgi:hypothetical protein